jgi:hypothetical protein
VFPTGLEPVTATEPVEAARRCFHLRPTARHSTQEPSASRPIPASIQGRPRLPARRDPYASSLLTTAYDLLFGKLSKISRFLATSLENFQGRFQIFSGHFKLKGDCLGTGQLKFCACKLQGFKSKSLEKALE